MVLTERIPRHARARVSQAPGAAALLCVKLSKLPAHLSSQPSVALGVTFNLVQERVTLQK